MKNLYGFIAVLLFSVHAPLKSQVWIEGRNLSYLKGQKQINIQFSYEGMKVKEVATLWNYDTRRSKAEEEFVKQESKKYENKGKARSGEEWANEWEINKNAKYEPEFRRLFARACHGITLLDTFNSNVKYTLIVHLLETDLGWSSGTALCDFEFIIVETKNPSLVKSKALMYDVNGLRYERKENGRVVAFLFFMPIMIFSAANGNFTPLYSPGSAFDFRTFSSRVKDCFAKCGRDFGRSIKSQQNRN